jgi:hypothetical protein
MMLDVAFTQYEDAEEMSIQKLATRAGKHSALYVKVEDSRYLPTNRW